MAPKTVRLVMPVALILIVAVLACNLPSGITQLQSPTNAEQPSSPPTSGSTQAADVGTPGSTSVPPTLTSAPAINHLTRPALPGAGKLIPDVMSDGTAPEKRAPYGDSYDINRLERLFLQDMTYVPDLDIASFSVVSDNDWWYVSIELIGSNPNNPLGIDYGVELDTDHDGFGDYLIWAHPPYATDWDTVSVQIFQDKNHDTGGLSAEKSDAPIQTDGYETQVFNGGAGDSDPDLAWVRMSAGSQSTVQFAFKKSWSGTVFMLGVIADAGLKDPKKLDYVDRFIVEQAGSPVRDNKNYPLKALFAVDNDCRAPFGFKATGYEPQLCPSTAPPATKRPKPTVEPSPQLCLPAGTMIDTPYGPKAVEGLRIGDAVWTSNAAGERVSATILKVARVPVPSPHPVIHIILSDGRELWASPGHPVTDGRTMSDVKLGDFLDGARVTLVETVSSDEPATYDLLPSGDTGFYWANGILIGSTLKEP